MGDDGSKTVAFRPLVVVAIAQDDNAAFGPHRMAEVVAFDNQHAHGGEGGAMFLGKAAVGGSIDGRKDGVVDETFVFFMVGSEPKIPVWMRRPEGLKKGRRARSGTASGRDMTSGARKGREVLPTGDEG